MSMIVELDAALMAAAFCCLFAWVQQSERLVNYFVDLDELLAQDGDLVVECELMRGCL